MPWCVFQVMRCGIFMKISKSGVLADCFTLSQNTTVYKQDLQPWKSTTIQSKQETKAGTTVACHPHIIVVVHSDHVVAVHSDCTYKCTWNGYPVKIMGFSDKNRTIHPIIVAISTHETKREFAFIFRQWKKINNESDFKFIVVDTAEAVYKAAKLVWPGTVRFEKDKCMLQCPAKLNSRHCKRLLRHPQH